MFELIIRSDFPAAHVVRGYQGKCNQLHGHTWKVEVVVQGRELDQLGMLIDFKVLKKYLYEVIDPLDHVYLNEHPAFKEVNPTTENIARYICAEFAKRLPAHITIQSVSVWESDRAGVRYLPE